MTPNHGDAAPRGRFRPDAELVEAKARLRDFPRATTDLRPSRKVPLAFALVPSLPLLAVVLWLGGWSLGGIMIVQSLTIPIGFLLISLGFTGREDVGMPLCGKCRHALPADTTPDRCGECGTWLRSGVQVVRDGRPVRKPGFIVAGSAILALYFGSLGWNMLGLSATLPNAALVALASTGKGDGGVWEEVLRRAQSGRLSPTELDGLAAVAIEAIGQDQPTNLRFRMFLEGEWLAGRLSPQRQRECVRLAYRLALERRGDRATLVASMRMAPQPSPSHFPRLAIGRLVIDGRPAPVVHRVFEHDAIPYEFSSDRPIEIDLGAVPAGAKAIAVEGFVLSSPFALGRAEWDAATGTLDLEPGTLAAPFIVEGTP